MELLLEIDWLEAAGLVFGLLAVWLLIKQIIWTWPVGIAYILISLYVFYTARLYADLALHVFYLGMHFYGWYFWLYGKEEDEEELAVTTTPRRHLIILLALSVVAIAVCGTLFDLYTDADLPYWDNTTTVLSVLGLWLHARKKIEAWALWLFIDILASGIYFYKELYFYSALYVIYIGMAVAGHIEWKRSMAGTGTEVATASPTG